MKRILFALLLLTISNLANAQWHEIADLKVWFQGDSVSVNTTCVYFIDLSGPPRIGFAGTDGGLWKTSDGGESWKRIIVYGYGWIEDMCFKDSLTGWFVAEGGGVGDTGSSLFRTTDGGETWNWIPVADQMDPAFAVCYVQGTNRLFVSIDSCVMVSTDLGDTWQTAICMDSGSQCGGFSFASDTVGYVAVIGAPDYSHPYTPQPNYILRTFDGGITWQQIKTNFYTQRPLAIRGTPICFAGLAFYVWRSDDYGQTWRALVYDTTTYRIDPSSIHGGLSSLYVQSGSAMLVSTDSGYTWQADGPSWKAVGDLDNFYADKGIVVTGMSYDSGNFEYGGGLWEDRWARLPDVVEQSAAADPPILRIFPNPASNSITVEPAAGLVTIYDPLGRVYKIPVHGSTLDISSLPAGVYYVSEGSERTKFIKE